MRHSTPTAGALGHLGNTGSPITYLTTDTARFTILWQPGKLLNRPEFRACFLIKKLDHAVPLGAR
jgi:hypothetical protein